MPITNPHHHVVLSGNTSGAMATVSSGTMTLAGGANITVSQAGNAVTISGGAGGGFSAGASNLGNTAGSTGVTGTRLVLVGTNNVTLSQSTDANGGTVSFSAAGGGAGQFSGGVSTGGNTSGDTGITGTRMVLAGVNNITMSQATDANGATVTASGANSWSIPTINVWNNAMPGAGTATAQLTSVGSANGSWYFFPLHPGQDVFPGNMTVSTMRVAMSGAGTSNAATASHTMSMLGGLYTMNGSSLSLLNSFSTALSTGAANNSQSSHYQGMRWWSIHSSQWSASPSLSQTHYWLGIMLRSSNDAKSISSMNFRGPTFGTLFFSGEVGVGSTSGSSTRLYNEFHGVYTATSSAPPVSVTKGEVAIPSATISAGAIPYILFDNRGLLV